MSTSDTAKQRRAARRAGWPGRLARVSELPEVEVTAGDPAELLALVTELSLRAWQLSGRPVPEYRREEIPGRLVRREPSA